MDLRVESLTESPRSMRRKVSRLQPTAAMSRAVCVVDGATARQMLSLKGDPSRPMSRSYFRALRRAMGRLDDRVFDVGLIRRWLAQHPDFKESSVYERTNSCPRLMCSCGREVSVMRGGRTHAHNKPDGTECCGVRV